MKLDMHTIIETINKRYLCIRCTGMLGVLHLDITYTYTVYIHTYFISNY